MAFTNSDVEALENAIATGAKVVRMDGREFEYQSTKQMIDALRMVRTNVAASEAANNGAPRRKGVFRIRYGGGY